MKQRGPTRVKPAFLFGVVFIYVLVFFATLRDRMVTAVDLPSQGNSYKAVAMIPV